MSNVFILRMQTTDWDGGEAEQILGVFDSKEGAQIELCQQVFMDEMWGGFSHCETNPKLNCEEFDLMDAYNEYKPIPLDFVHYSGGIEGDGPCTITYVIKEYPLKSVEQ